MSRSSRHFVLLLVLTIAPTPAHAENNSTRARLHYDRGSAAYESRNYELAIVEFQKSLVDAERPASYYALGLAGESAHREDVAVVGYRKYLLLAPMGPVQLHDHASAYVTEYDLRAQRARELERDRQVERERGTHPGNSLVPSSVSSSRWYTSAAGWGLLDRLDVDVICAL